MPHNRSEQEIESPVSHHAPGYSIYDCSGTPVRIFLTPSFLGTMTCRILSNLMFYAKRSSIDLIVMGTTQKRWLDRFLLGSVSENVVRISKIPVLVTPF